MSHFEKGGSLNASKKSTDVSIENFGRGLELGQVGDEPPHQNGPADKLEDVVGNQVNFGQPHSKDPERKINGFDNAFRNG